MEGTLSKEYELLRSDFSDIVRKAYEKGTSDGTITVEEMIKDIKVELLKLKVE